MSRRVSHRISGGVRPRGVLPLPVRVLCVLGVRACARELVCSLTQELDARLVLRGRGRVEGLRARVAHVEHVARREPTYCTMAHHANTLSQLWRTREPTVQSHIHTM